jgi:hypothetical protein
LFRGIEFGQRLNEASALVVNDLTGIRSFAVERLIQSPVSAAERKRRSRARQGHQAHYRDRGDPPDPILVIRRVGHQAQIQDFDGRPYSELMPVEEATAALREALDTERRFEAPPEAPTT